MFMWPSVNNQSLVVVKALFQWGWQSRSQRWTGTAAGRQRLFLSGSEGLTLVELLITVSIMAMIALAVFSALAGGLNVYQRLRANVTDQTDVLLSLEKMERDLRSAFPLATIGFQGDSARMRFPGILPKKDEAGNRALVPGSIAYYYDPLTQSLEREADEYAYALSGERLPGACPEFMARVERIQFSYCCANLAAQTYEWKSAWGVNDGTPLGVRIELAYRYGRQSVVAERTVFLPGAW